ncbi:MAG: ribosome maturation factor RimP [Candidatus Lernaella stagnicola]|nr:ribosome maturation factor RimP [Candidatus Lernaella stagnicola]
MWRFIPASPRTKKLVDMARAACEATGVDLYYVEVNGGRRGRVFVVIDAVDGVSIDDCQRVSRSLSAALDVDAPFARSFLLEVSSPGVDRRLRDLDDLTAMVGKTVQLETKEPRDGQRKFVGSLREVIGETLRIEIDGKVHEIDADQVRKANLVFDFGTANK